MTSRNGNVWRPLERMGGGILHPRKIFDGILNGAGGSMFELLPWMVLVTLTVAPTESGQIVLMGRGDLFVAVRMLLGLVTNRLGGALVGAAVGALVLSGLSALGRRGRDRRGPGYDRLLDATTYCLVPFLALASLGALLRASGVEVWFLPHRLLSGRGMVLATRVLVAFGGPLILFGVLATRVWHHARAEHS